MHFAELDAKTNRVIRVLVCDHGMDWLEKNLGGIWRRTYYDTPGKNYAGPFYTYHPDREDFSPPQPFPSWSLNKENLRWDPPIPYPEDMSLEKFYIWDEDLFGWKLIHS